LREQPIERVHGRSGILRLSVSSDLRPKTVQSRMSSARDDADNTHDPDIV
jgi:hypothetical protein